MEVSTNQRTPSHPFTISYNGIFPYKSSILGSFHYGNPKSRIQISRGNPGPDPTDPGPKRRRPHQVATEGARGQHHAVQGHPLGTTARLPGEKWVFTRWMGINRK